MKFMSRLYGTDHTHVFSTVPRGWRFADEHETTLWTNLGDVRQVRQGGTDDDPWTDLVVPE